MALDVLAVLTTTQAAFYPNSPSAVQANPPGANTDFLATAITVPSWCKRVTVQISTSVSSVFNARINGTTASLNGGTALAAACVYAFDIAVVAGDTLNFQLATNGTMSTFVVQGAAS